jgi:hypothetical protein
MSNPPVASANPRPLVIMTNAGLDELGSAIILRGVLDANSLRLLQSAPYQREANPVSSLKSIIGAIQNGDRLPDIEIGMRGQRFDDVDGMFALHDDLFIIDGLQRVTAALHVHEMNPEIPINLGATVHFDTSMEWERERFRVLNTLRSRVSPNVLMKNLGDTNEGIKLLVILSNNSSFIMKGRVSWRQSMANGELITALLFAKVALRLHEHKIDGGRVTGIDPIAIHMNSLVKKLGPQVVSDNMKTFFDFVDQVWGIKRVAYRDGASYMRGNFLLCMAQLFSSHTDFWRKPEEKRLEVGRNMISKMKSFPISDPTVASLASGSTKSLELLYLMMSKHVNSGRRTGRLDCRYGEMVFKPNDDCELDEAA